MTVASSRRLRSFAVVLALGGLATSAVFVGCSAKHDPAPGEIFLAIDTNLKVPDDLDSIGISVVNDQGKPQEDQIFPLGPGTGAQFPATFAVVRGTSTPVTIRVAGYKGGNAVTVREATTTLPESRTVLLPLDLDYLNVGMVTGTVATTVSQLTTTCAAGTTPIGGICQAITLDSLSLGDYEPALLGKSTDSSAVDIDACFAGGSSLSPSSSSGACTAPVPGSSVNFGLMLPAGSAGWCNGSRCVVPLVGASGDGWNIAPDGTIHLPQAVCDKALPVFTTPVTASCPSFSLLHPARQKYGVVADSGTGTGTPPDAGAADAGTVVTLPRSNIGSISADDTSVYIVRGSGSSTSIERVPLAFEAGQTTTPVTVSYELIVGESAAQYPYVALPVLVGSAQSMLVVDMADGGATPFGSSVDVGNVALATGADGGAVVVYINGPGTPALSASDVATSSKELLTNNQPAYGIASTPGDGGTLVAYSQGTGGFYTGTFPSFSKLVSMVNANPNHVAFVDDQRIVWVDNMGALYASGPTSKPDQALLLTDSGVSNKQTAILAGGGGRVFWLSSTGVIYEAQLGDNGFTTTPAPANVGSATSGVTSLLVRSGTLYWADVNNVYRQPLSAIP